MRRRALWSAGAVGALVAAVALAGIMILRSQWFLRKLHDTVVQVTETATGGRAEVGAIQFDWRNLRARVAPFTLHGTEPAGKPPLFQASSITIGLKIVSLARRKVDLRELEIAEPRIYLMIGADGQTNIPGPKTAAGKPAVATILDLAVGRFELDRGSFTIDEQTPEPFSARGQNFHTRLVYDAAGPRYRGDIAIDPLDVQIPGLAPLAPAAIQTSLVVERNRIQIIGGQIHTGGAVVEFAGGIENLAAPQAKLQIEAHIPAGELGRLIKLPELRAGMLQLTGTGLWSPAAGPSLTGRLHATGLRYRDNSVRLDNFRLDGNAEANVRGLMLHSAHVAGLCPSCVIVEDARGGLPIEGTIARGWLRGRDVDLDGMELAALGGTFRGLTRLRDFRDYHVEGQVLGFQARPVVALYSTEPLPWDALASGDVQLDGALGHVSQLRASGQWEVTPVAEGAPVHGHIVASYAAGTSTLDLGNSTLSLPSSRVDFSGTLGDRLRAHLETRNFGDLLPAAGRSAASLPVKLENGSAVFDGTITGKLDQARIEGHVRMTGLAGEGPSMKQRLDAIEGDLVLASDSLRVTNGSAALGSLHAQFQGQVALRDWKADDPSLVSGTGTFSAANLADVLVLAKGPSEEASGALNVTAQVSGTIGEPLIEARLEATKGVLHGEPFDRFTAVLHASGTRIDMNAGQFTAGSKQVRLAASFEHPRGQFDAGKLHFQTATNAMALEQIKTLGLARPGLQGAVTLTASGDAAVEKSQLRLTGLEAELAGRGLQLTGQALGDATVTARSEGQVLRAKLDSNFADSHLLGEGEWKLEGDEPGGATITFSKLDFAQLRAWIVPRQADTKAPAADVKASAADTKTPPEPPPEGFAEGQVRIDGPLFKTAGWRAELRLTSFEIRPAQNGGAPAGLSLAFRNSGPIVARMANSVVSVESAHLTGRSTDISISGRVALDQKNPLDLRVNGHVDLAILHDLDRDFASSGILNTDATVRGTFSDPQIVGRVQFQNAAFSLADFPNGVSNAGGEIVFTKDRATIQNFSGETGGGKLELSGFAGYTGGMILYRLHARADHVRVRYPEGVSTVANANLSLTGTRDRSMLSGTVTVLRTSFNPQGDFSSLISHSAEPVQTASAQTGLLGGMSFSVQINTAPDLQLQSVLTQDLEVEANLTLRGSPSNPALLGRITITQGQVVFYGTKFNVNEGSISFFNPLRIDPVLNIDLETKERGIDVTLTISGPMTHPNLTPHSDPPLQFNEIVALLATGEGPSSDPTLLQQQTTAPNSWQQMGASALLGQAIASPVSGRLQRFFGVSKLRIDPTLAGVENNPQARLTLDQQVTSAITFTYITDVTSSNPQVVRVEWALSKQWSVVALREENGVFGIDFYLKKRF